MEEVGWEKKGEGRGSGRGAQEMGLRGRGVMWRI